MSDISDIDDDGFDMAAPKKADFRQRAHCNPLADTRFAKPLSPNHVDWKTIYPLHFDLPYTSDPPVNCANFPASYSNDLTHVYASDNSAQVPTILDIGCGFGSFLLKLAELYPSEMCLGVEIRDKVSEFVGRRIRSQRVANAAIIRTNSMKYFAHYMKKASLRSIFICFPDPHFKKSNWRRRIVNPSTVCDYAYGLRQGGCLYMISDVLDWIEHSMAVMNEPRQRSLFRCVYSSSNASIGSPCDEDSILLEAMKNTTDEAMKVQRTAGPTFAAIFQRI